MTQVNSAQVPTRELALRKRADDRNLAQRRAAFAAQMREMALSDLDQVSRRLRGLHKDLERKEGRKWTDIEIAQAMKLSPRTFQSWQNGEVENQDGKGYVTMARWYSRKLGRKITKQWILFGDEEAAPAEEPAEDESPEDRLQQVEEKLDDILRWISSQKPKGGGGGVRTSPETPARGKTARRRGS
jgi:transcriptional regulator with XRE-family HTH domain